MNIKKIILGTGILGTVKILTMISGLLQSMILAHLLSVDNYASYGQCTTLISTISGLTIFGFADSVIYFCGVAKNDRSRNSYLTIIFLFETLICIFSGILLFSLKEIFSQLFKSETVGIYMYLLAFFPFIINISTCLSQLLFVESKVKSIAFGNLFFSFGSLSIAFIISNNNNPIFLYLILTLALYFLFICFQLFFYLFGKNRFIKFATFDKATMFAVLKYTLPLGLSIIGSTLLKEFDKIIISNQCSELDFATYTAVSRQLPITFFSYALAVQIVPLLVKSISAGDQEKTHRLLNLYFTIGFVTTIIIGLAILCVSKQTMLFLYSDKYSNGILIFIVYIFVDIATFIYPGQLLMVSGRTNELLIHSIIMVIVNIILNVVFLKFWGIIGPAIATLIVQTGALVIQIFRGMKTNNLSIKGDIPWKHIVVCAFVCIPTTICFGLLSHFFTINIVVDIILYGGACGIVNLVICGFYLIKTKVINMKGEL